MFLNKDFILSSELTQKMGIHTANISALRKEFENEGDSYNILKLNNCTFINTRCRKLPKNIREGIEKNTFTDMSNKLPCTYIRTEFSMTERELKNAGLVIDKVTVADKDFFVFTDEWVKKLKGKIGYVLNKQETEYCLERKQIIGCVQLNSNKFFTWY